MEILLNKLSDTEAVIKVNVKEEDYQSALDKKIKDYSKKATIKGFRPGKVPTGVIKKMYGNSIKVEEINQQVSQELNSYIRENKLDILGYPLPDIEKASTIDWENQTSFEFDYAIGMPGDFSVDLSKDLGLNQYKVVVSEEDIKNSIESLQKKYGAYSHPEVSEQGNVLFGEISNEDGSIKINKSIEIEDRLKDAFKSKLIGLQKEDTITFEASEVSEDEHLLSFLFDKTINEVKELKDVFTFKVEDVTAIEPAELNEELYAKAFGDTVKSEEELEARIREDLERDYNHHADLFFKAEARKKITEATAIDLPDSFIKRWLLQAEEGKRSQEEIERDFPQYTADLKWTLIQEKLMKDHDIKVESEEIRAEAKQMIEQQFKAYNIPLDDDNVNGMVENYLRDQEGKNAQNVYNNLLADKIATVLKDKLSPEVKEISPKEFGDLRLD